jgi:hypothetical protein
MHTGCVTPCFAHGGALVSVALAHGGLILPDLHADQSTASAYLAELRPMPSILRRAERQHASRVLVPCPSGSRGLSRRRRTAAPGYMQQRVTLANACTDGPAARLLVLDRSGTLRSLS